MGILSIHVKKFENHWSLVYIFCDILWMYKWTLNIDLSAIHMTFSLDSLVDYSFHMSFLCLYFKLFLSQLFVSLASLLFLQFFCFNWVSL